MEMTMLGEQTIILNQDTVVEALQQYLERELGTTRRITILSVENNNSTFLTIRFTAPSPPALVDIPPMR